MRLSPRQTQPQRCFLALNEHDDIDLLLLDLGLPDAQDSARWFRRASAIRRSLIVVVSGHEQPDIVSRTLAHGAAGFVPKSASSATLMEALLPFYLAARGFRRISSRQIRSTRRNPKRLRGSQASLRSNSACSSCFARGCRTSRSAFSSTSPKPP